MSGRTPLPQATERALAKARRSVLIVLGACGVGALAMTSAKPSPLPSTTDSLVTTVVLLLALGAIAARQIAARQRVARAQTRWLFAAYAFAAALGIAGLLLAVATGEALRGMSYVLAGAIFALAGMRLDRAGPGRSLR